MSKTLIILSAPSGVGKTTVTKRFLQTNPDWQQVITCTTRPPRAGEKDGIDYRFLTEDSFDKLVRADKFLEYAVVHGQFYGTLMSDVELVWGNNFGAILVIDTQGKETVKAKLPGVVTIFLLPPTDTEMERRLRNRRTDSEEVIQIRLHRALAEIKDAYTYDHVLVNEDVEETVRGIQAILNETNYN